METFSDGSEVEAHSRSFRDVCVLMMGFTNRNFSLSSELDN